MNTLLIILGAGVTWLFITFLIGWGVGAWLERKQIDLLGEDETEMTLYPYADRDVRGLPR